MPSGTVGSDRENVGFVAVRHQREQGGEGEAAGDLQAVVLEHAVVGDGDIQPGQPPHRRFQVIERFALDNAADDLAAEAAGLDGLMHHQRTPGLLHAGDDGFIVQRAEGARVNHFDFDALAGQPLRDPVA